MFLCNLEIPAALVVKVMDAILHNVTSRHASENTKYYALYCRFILRLSKAQIAVVFCKSPTTISTWIRQYEDTGSVVRKSSRNIRLFSDNHIQWFKNFYEQNPLAFLDEAQLIFKNKFAISISISSVWRILHNLLGLTRKVC